MAYSEAWGDAPDIILDGEPVRGRTKLHKDGGGYQALDLVELRQKDALRVQTASGDTHYFVKTRERDEDGVEVGAVDGWVRRDVEAKIGADIAGRFVFLEPNPQGTSFLTPSVVMRRGMELGFIPNTEPPTHVIQNLGIIARINSGSSQEETFETVIAGLEEQLSTSV
jgi:hypothetical protein